MFKHIHFIINPAAGKEEPILSYIHKVFHDSDIDWDISVAKKGKNVRDIAGSLINKTELIAVYGGDGSVTGVAAALHNSPTPMAIIPGGTANVMAKELGIPLDTVAALELLRDGHTIIKPIDMGMVNDQPFLLRVNLGVMADMVINTDRRSKDNLGQFAYGIAGIKTLADAEPVKYILTIDGKTTEEEAVALTITNSGNTGIGSFALQPGISITDGLLDILLLSNTDLSTILKLAGSTILQSETDAIKHWTCREVIVTMPKEQSFICDDTEMSASELKIKVAPGSVNIVIPTSDR